MVLSKGNRMKSSIMGIRMIFSILRQKILQNYQGHAKPFCFHFPAPPPSFAIRGYLGILSSRYWEKYIISHKYAPCISILLMSTSCRRTKCIECEILLHKCEKNVLNKKQFQIILSSHPITHIYTPLFF